MYCRFRWVFCQLEYLRRCIPGRIRLALNELPETLDKTYERSLEEIDEQNWKFAHRLFQCVAAASRPLLVNELAEFLAFDFDTGSTPTFLIDWRPEDPAHTVLSMCPSFLAVVKQRNGSPVVQFVHFSVKEYLTSRRLTKAKDSISRFHVSMIPAHTILAQACLGALLHLDKNPTRKELETFPLAEYAAENWVGHTQFENVSSKIQDGMKRLFDPRRNHLSVWVWIRDPDDPRSRFWRSYQPEQARAKPLHYAALCGVQDVAAFLINERLQDVNVRGFDKKETPLHVASRLGHVDIVRLLLEHGADAQAQDDDKRTPLLLASLNGHLEAARVLLEHGANTEVRYFRKQTQAKIFLVSEDGRAEVVYRDKSDESETPSSYSVSERNKFESNPLLLASQVGHVEFARVLLKHGADTEAVDNGKRTPLLLAMQLGHVDVVRVLLEHAADVNARDANNATPLHMAFRSIDSPDPDIVRLLLRHKPNIHAQDNKGQTPFMMAKEQGNHSIIRLLSEYETKHPRSLGAEGPGMSYPPDAEHGWTPPRTEHDWEPPRAEHGWAQPGAERGSSWAPPGAAHGWAAPEAEHGRAPPREEHEWAPLRAERGWAPPGSDHGRVSPKAEYVRARPRDGWTPPGTEYDWAPPRARTPPATEYDWAPPRAYTPPATEYDWAPPRACTPSGAGYGRAPPRAWTPPRAEYGQAPPRAEHEWALPGAEHGWGRWASPRADPEIFYPPGAERPWKRNRTETENPGMPLYPPEAKTPEMSHPPRAERFSKRSRTETTQFPH